MKLDRVERLLKLIQLLHSGRSFQSEDLSEFLGVNRRTVFRDLDLLRKAGVRYHFDRKTQRYRVDQENSLPPVSLTYGESLALMLATRHLMTSPMMAYRREAESAAIKIESLLPRALQDYCGPILDTIEILHQPQSDVEAITDTFAVVQLAMKLRRKLVVCYDSYKERAIIEDVLLPYRLSHIRWAWYTIAFSEKEGAVRTYKLERFTNISTSGDSYEIDPTFNLDEYFGNAWLMIRGDKPWHVKVRFKPMVAGNVEEISWHRTQRTTWDEDGSLIFEVDVDGLSEILWWILGYGDQAEVLEPAELRRDILAVARRMVEYYGKNEKLA